MRATIQQTIGDLRQTLTDYIEATYHIGHPSLVEQRRRLLNQAGGTFQEPYLESTPRYVFSKRYEDMTDIPAVVRETFAALSDAGTQKPLLYNPPYLHQADAVREVLSNSKNLMIMTGTGSGKTESFLLPILGKLAIEARLSPETFKAHTGVRAIVLYPMNALVNDQLGRLRLMFGDARVIKMFEDWAGRPARFARYTSRTPYAGVRSPKRDSARLKSMGAFFVEMEEAANRHAAGKPRIPEEDARAYDLMHRLAQKGKWPAKASMGGWFGKPGGQWRTKKGYVRAVLGARDAELLTRHEVHQNPPDLLITNYSMLEYMMMRPIERDIFERTREWLTACPDEKILVVLDEAHLYRGAQGAEVGLLLRRLRERLNIGPDRFQVICSTASFSDEGKKSAELFGAQLAGVPADSFYKVEGKLQLRDPDAFGSAADVAALCAVDLARFYAEDVSAQKVAIAPLLVYRKITPSDDVELDLVNALTAFGPFNKLVNETMKAAVPLAKIGTLVFPNLDGADAAVDALLALGSRARKAPGEPSLIPCRIHSFFRGLPGLWACMDAQCGALDPGERGGPVGKLYTQPIERCSCTTPVLEYFTCRYCGTSYARAYTNRLDAPQDLWAESGHRLLTDAGLDESYRALDLLLEEPFAPDMGEPANYDLRTGQLNPTTPTMHKRMVYLTPMVNGVRTHGEFLPCGCCEQQLRFGGSSVQDHQTKGDQPFQALLTSQIQVQPPGPTPASQFAPLRGRKVLIFSDSRQMAARLVQLLQGFSLRDTVRALLPLGFKLLSTDTQLGPSLNLNHAYLAVLAAAHKLGVRLRPALDSGEKMPVIVGVPMGETPTSMDMMEFMSGIAPSDLMKAIAAAVNEKERGLEALAIATIAEAPALTAKVKSLPDLPGFATDDDVKLAVVRAWLRCWARGPGVWYATMNPNLWNVEVVSHGLNFDAMENVVPKGAARRAFTKEWIPRLGQMFTQAMPGGGTQLLAVRCSLMLEGGWQRCLTCRSVHRPIANVTQCIDCTSPHIEDFDPDTDDVFRARRGYYRRPIRDALTDNAPELIALIAAEHTAQLNAAQVDEAFSQAEQHEVRFQDIDLAWRDTDLSESAIDVLSSTTTMEVGIDIGELSGVALRNMPPARANYQQRAGRAGRRGNAVATVLAFGSSDSHDDHYFTHPDEMIRGPVVDPRLTLENADIARRHLRAFLLQRYHEDRLPDVDPNADPNLFSVLGRVRDFRDGTGVLNFKDFDAWLSANQADLQQAADRWLPHELSKIDRDGLIANMRTDVLGAVEDAIGGAIESEADETASATEGEGEEGGDEGVEDEIAEAAEEDNEGELFDRNRDKLLDRLLYMGVLPRYAFPTDVAAFYVFSELSTPYFARMEFAPSQGLNIALSQYAPNKQIWIKAKQYTSKAIYSPYRQERFDAWGKRKLFFECSRCGHARTQDYDKALRKAQFDCEACNGVQTFGPGRSWFRPPGFAHPCKLPPATTPDPRSETAYATRAKLVMPTPGGADGWDKAGPRVRVYPTREKLLVSNSGPKDEGYHYCTECGAIEAAADVSVNLFVPHERPYPNDEEQPCNGYVERNIVLGTDFRTDVCLYSLPLDDPFRLQPGNSETDSALRTVCEALAKAGAQLLQIESSEVLAEYRPALTDAGANGLEAEIFFYDTLAGGAGFSPQLAAQSEKLFSRALEILTHCPEPDCDTSCYRCLRSFRNRLDHRLLDRVLGEQLLRHAMTGGYPDYRAKRVNASLDVLRDELERQAGADFVFIRRARSKDSALAGVAIPILAANRNSGAESWIALASPIAATAAVDGPIRALKAPLRDAFILVDDLRVRRHLPAAVDSVRAALN